MNVLDADYWNQRYLEGQTGWDIGYISTPIKEYIDQLRDKTSSILIPGAGNAYEAGYLHDLGFENVHILDLSQKAIENFIDKYPGFNNNHIHQEDFFDHRGNYDLIIEQTFFCAIDPTLRERYVEKVRTLLKDRGKLVGLLWDDPMFSDRPPFGGSTKEYGELFKNDFHISVMEKAYNSIAPRRGREVFIKFDKK